MMVDAGYEEPYQAMKPGIRENECVGLVNKVLYDMGSEQVEGVNAISGERCSPHPHVYTDRVLRPGDPAYFDIVHSYMGYRTCYYRTFAVGSASPALVDACKRCRDYLDAAIDMIKPGTTTADVVKVCSDGWSAARIEEELVVTKDGCEVITRFPAEDLLVAGTCCHTSAGPLPGTREIQSHLNRADRGSQLEPVKA